MEKFDSTFIQPLMRLVFLIGKQDTVNTFLSQIQKIKDAKWDYYKFRHADILNFPAKTNKILNQKLPGEGYLRSNWLDKRTRTIPSTVIYLNDWRDENESGVREKELILANEYSKYRENLKVRNITPLFVFVLSKNTMTSERLESIKKQFDIDSKNIHMILNNFDNLFPIAPKIEKCLEDGAKNHYNELLKRHKNRMAKNDMITNTEFNLRLNLKIAMLYEILGKIDKSKLAYNEAYSQIVSTIFPHYLSQISSMSKLKPETFLTVNMSTICVLEELRHLADCIKQREMAINIFNEEDIKACHKTLHSHISQFRGKIEYLDNRFKFEEYRWKAKLYQSVIVLLFEAMERKPKIFEDAPPNAIIVHGYIEMNMARRKFFLQHNQNLKAQEKRKLDWESPYYGMNKYKYPNTEDYPKFTDIGYVNDILTHRLQNEVVINQHLTCIDILERNIKLERELREWKELKDYKDPKEFYKFGFVQLYLLSQQYYLNNQKDAFFKHVDQLMNQTEVKSWPFLLTKLLLENQKFLTEQADYFAIVHNCLRLCIINQQTAETEQLLQNALQNVENQTFKYTAKNRKIFNLKVGFKPQSVNYLEDFFGEIYLTIPNYLIKYITDITVRFNDSKYDQQFKIDDLKPYDKGFILTFTNHAIYLLPNNRISVSQVIFSGRVNEAKQVAFEFVVPKESFCFSKDNVVMLKLVDDLNVSINCDQPAYYSETVNLALNIEKKAPEIKIKYVSVYIYVIEKNQLFEIVPRVIPKDLTLMYKDNNGNCIEYDKDTNLNMLEFEPNSTKMSLNFTLMSPISMTKTFSICIKYEVTREAYNKLIDIPKQINQNFVFKTQAPFQYFLNWKTNLKDINHSRDAKSVSYKHPIPVNNTSCLAITLSPLQNNVIIKEATFKINKSPNYILLKEPSIPKDLILSRNHHFTSHLVLRPKQEMEDFYLGEIQLSVLRLEEKERTDKNAVPVTISLEYITAKARPFSVNIEIQNSCILGEPMPLLYHIHNKSDHLQKVEALVPDSEAFLITGYTKIVLEMLPRSSKTLEYLIVPVVIGKQKAPSCLLKCVTTEENLLDSEEAVITYVYPPK